MKKYVQLLQLNPLFKNFSEMDIETILACLSARFDFFNKKDIILLQGDSVQSVGVVLSGSVQVIKEDFEGKVNVLTQLGENNIFAEAFAFAGINQSPVTVQAVEDCEILLIDCQKMIKTCHESCVFHSSLIENMLYLIARKNITLHEKIEVISKRTIREKLFTYLNTQIQMARSKKITIPYNREDLANYLCVDRSALSRELCKLRDEGLIKFNKNEFEIHETIKKN